MVKTEKTIRRRSSSRLKIVGSLKSIAKAGEEAFRKCRPDIEDFILDLENKLYSKGVITKEKHDIINDIHGPSIVQKRQILLDAVESWLRLADSGAEFEDILDILKEDQVHDIVAEKLSEARETCLLPIVRRNRSPRNWLVVPILTVIFPTILAAILLWYSRKVESESTRFLKDKYSTSDLMLEPGYYSNMPYVHLSIFDRSWMTKSRKKQVSHNFSQPVSLDELLNVSTGDRILIIGGPGTGKTRLTLEIMRMWTNSKVLLSCELLFVYRLRWFSLQKKEIDLKNIVSMHMEGDSVVDEIVNEAHSTGGKKICFLFDGLNEYEPGYSEIDNYIFLLMHRQKLSNAVVIVTTRNITSTGFKNINWTKRYHVTGFSDEQLKSYFQNYFMQSGINFTSLVTTHENLWQMCKIPLHVSLLVNAFSNEEVDTTIFTATELFKAIIIKTFESDLIKANEPGKTIIIKDLRHLLKFSVITKVCALAIMGSLSTPRQYSFTDFDVPHELRWTNLSYFQIEPQPGGGNMEVYSFTHPALMDFLAAVYFTSLSESEQIMIANKKQCQNINFGYDNFWKFVCGLTTHFTPLFKILYDCYMFIWLRLLKMAHCIFEAQSHSTGDHEIQSAAKYLMQRENKGHLTLMFTTLTVYDMQALGFVASSSPGDLRGLILMSVTVTDRDYDLSFLFYSLANSRAIFFNFEVLLLSQIIYTEIKSEQPVMNFFKCTPKLKILQLIDVSEHILQQLTLLAPHSCKTILVYKTYFGTNAKITPHSLFKQRRQMSQVRVARCKLRDKHLFDMRSIPWSVNTILFGLSHNFIGNEGAISIALSIRLNLCDSFSCTRKSLCGPYVFDLKYNNIGGEGLVALLEAAPCTIFIDLTGNNITDNDVDAIIKTCLNFFRVFPIKILLEQNRLTEDGKAKLRHIIRKSKCHIYFESGPEIWFQTTKIGHLYETIEDVIATSVSSEHNIQTINKQIGELEIAHRNYYLALSNVLSSVILSKREIYFLLYTSL